MDYIYLSETLINTLTTYAVEGKPREVCGLLVGVGVRVNRVIPIPNISEDPESRYYMDPTTLIKRLASVEEEGLSLMGFYHSHPTGEPIPSPTDIQQANYPGAAHIIIGLKHDHPVIAAWHINQWRVDRISIFTDTNIPEDLNGADLSQARKVAILSSIVITVVLLVMLSLSLLPPAPAIPALP